MAATHGDAMGFAAAGLWVSVGAPSRWVGRGGPRLRNNNPVMGGGGCTPCHRTHWLQASVEDEMEKLENWPKTNLSSSRSSLSFTQTTHLAQMAKEHQAIL